MEYTFNYVPDFFDCLKLVEIGDVFNSKEEKINNHTIVSFMYRFATYSDFCIPGSRNLRGITFDKESKTLLALPFHKFFNYKENDFTQDESIANKQISLIREKIDGSLIMFFMLDNVLYAKTKMGCFNDQSNWSMNIVNNNTLLKKEIIYKIENGFTPMFEFISPRNRIVIFYEHEELIYLGARNMKDGSYNFDKMKNCKNTEEYENENNINSMVNMIQTFSNKEGIVVVFSDGDMMKIKTEDYIMCHRAKNSIFNKKYLAELVISGNIDDIKPLFADNIEIMHYINANESIILQKYNMIILNANKFYEENNNLGRKEYAIKASAYFNSIEFDLAMSLFIYEKINFEKFNRKFINDCLWEI